MREYATEREAIIAVGEMDTSGGFTAPERLVFRGARGGYRAALAGPSLTGEYVAARRAEGCEFIGKVYGNHGNRAFTIRFDRYDADEDAMVFDHTLQWRGSFAGGAYVRGMA